MTHRRVFTVTSFLTFHNRTMKGTRNIALKLGNDGAYVVTNVGHGPMRVSRRGRWRFSGCTGSKDQISVPLLTEIADLA